VPLRSGLYSGVRGKIVVIAGLTALREDPALLRGRRFAVLANQAAVTGGLVPAWRALSGRGGELVRIFAPEHGLWGVAQDMETVGEEREPSLGVAVHSLYGADASTLGPRDELLADLDALVVDLPDIGCRYYTFAATMAYVMGACARAGVEVIVCDRPNPLGGAALEGGEVEPGCRSFVSELPVPIRHGLTLGELALLLRARRYPDLTLSVLSCQGWTRERWWDETGLPWAAPSPNMPTLETAAVYPGACLVEATILSEGRGTTRPFHLVGAPWLDAESVARDLERAELAGVAFRAIRFRPAFQKFAGEVCEGLAWHLTDRALFRPLETGVALLRAVRDRHPDRFEWRPDAYEFVADVPAIDLLTGSPRARDVIEGRHPLAELREEWEAFCARFREERREFLLYPESD
jgi:uncharacterized protein YbbC (DUF1343 family)